MRLRRRFESRNAANRFRRFTPDGRMQRNVLLVLLLHEIVDHLWLVVRNQIEDALVELQLMTRSALLVVTNRRHVRASGRRRKLIERRGNKSSIVRFCKFR